MISKSALETLVTLGAGMAAIVVHDVYTARRTARNKKPGKRTVPQFMFVLPASIVASYLGWKYIPKINGRQSA